MQFSAVDSKNLENTIQLALDEVRRIALSYFRIKDLDWQQKNDLSPCTQADLAIEDYLRNFLSKAYPNFGFWGEETGRTAGSSDYAWLIDPIDGTRAFLSGNPIFACLVGLYDQKQKRCIFGAAEVPFLKERWLAWAEPVAAGKTRPTENLKDSLAAATSPFMFTSLGESFLRLLDQSFGSFRWGGDAYNYALLAEGQLDLVIESDMKFYDCAALIPIVQAAGGVITDWQGNKLEENFAGRVLASANDTLHQKALQLLAGF